MGTEGTRINPLMQNLLPALFNLTLHNTPSTGFADVSIYEEKFYLLLTRRFYLGFQEGFSLRQMRKEIFAGERSRQKLEMLETIEEFTEKSKKPSHKQSNGRKMEHSVNDNVQEFEDTKTGEYDDPKEIQNDCSLDFDRMKSWVGDVEESGYNEVESDEESDGILENTKITGNNPNIVVKAESSPENRDEQELQNKVNQLMDLGFKPHWCRQALEKSRRQVDRAVDWMINNMDSLTREDDLKTVEDEERDRNDGVDETSQGNDKSSPRHEVINNVNKNEQMQEIGKGTRTVTRTVKKTIKRRVPREKKINFPCFFQFVDLEGQTVDRVGGTSDQSEVDDHSPLAPLIDDTGPYLPIRNNATESSEIVGRIPLGDAAQALEICAIDTRWLRVYNWNPVDNGSGEPVSGEDGNEEDTPTGWVKYRNSSNHALLVLVDDEDAEQEWDEIEVEEMVEETIEITDEEELEKIYKEEKKAAKAKQRKERREAKEKAKVDRQKKRVAQLVSNRNERYKNLVEKSNMYAW